MINLADWDQNISTQRMVIFTDAAGENLAGKRLPIIDRKGNQFVMKFNHKINLTTLDVATPADSEYNSPDFVELNQLIAEGKMAEWFPYEMVDLNDIFGKPEYLTPKGRGINVKAIQKFFRDHGGWEVTKEAIRHQYNAWRGDLKSGFRDDAEGYHLFSACGCNPFSIRLTSLSALCRDWQKTYEI